MGSTRKRKLLKINTGLDSNKPVTAIPFVKINSTTSANSVFTSLTALKSESLSVESAGYMSSAFKLPIVVNGRVVNDIKHRERPRTAPHMIGERPRTAPRTIGGLQGLDGVDQIPCRTIGRKSVTADQLDELKTTDNVEILADEFERKGRRRRRRRPVKEDMKYIVGKMVPTPIKGMKAALTKRKRYDLERSHGCLT